jgi:quercetin dioxygenase-like cupin family protein
MTLKSTTVAVLAGLILFGGVVTLDHEATATRAQRATPAAAAPVVIASEVFASIAPAAVENPELGLARVTIMPGAAIPTHYHPGTQIAFIAQGDVTYEVFTGEITWYHADDPANPPDTISAGDTTLVRTGDTLVETPGSIHQGRNEGDVPITIYLATLFTADEPRSISVEVTPAP